MAITNANPSPASPDTRFRKNIWYSSENRYSGLIYKACLECSIHCDAKVKTFWNSYPVGSPENPAKSEKQANILIPLRELIFGGTSSLPCLNSTVQGKLREGIISSRRRDDFSRQGKLVWSASVYPSCPDSDSGMFSSIRNVALPCHHLCVSCARRRRCQPFDPTLF